MDIQFQDDLKYTVDGREFTYSGRAMNVHVLETIFARMLAVFNYTDKPDCVALAMAMANVFIKNGCLVCVSKEHDDYFHPLFPQIVDEYVKNGGILEKLETENNNNNIF